MRLLSLSFRLIEKRSRYQNSCFVPSCSLSNVSLFASIVKTPRFLSPAHAFYRSTIAVIIITVEKLKTLFSEHSGGSGMAYQRRKDDEDIEELAVPSQGEALAYL